MLFLMKIKLFIYPSEAFETDSILNTASGASYSIEDRIGTGGNGAVYRCVEQSTGNEYAVKFLLKYDGADKRRRRFHHECEKLKELNHQHIIRHIESGKVSAQTKNRKGRLYSRDIDYLLMDIANDGDLNGAVKQKETIEPEIYKAQFRGLSEALMHIHNHDLIHRDIKPENILILGDRWVLSDFGLSAPVNRAGRDFTGDENLGPRFWMSPEMTNRCLGIRNQYSKINKASDVYQLASVFWYIVNKRHPSGISKPNDWGGMSGLCNVVRKALDYCPNRRFQTGAEFHEALVNAIES